MYRYRFSCLVASFYALSALASPADSEDFSVSMDAVELLPTSPTGEVIGANPADPQVWPTTFTFKNRNGNGCTSTAVGERVILTAAHCVEHGGSGKIRTGASTLEVGCEHHPKYPANVSADFALCLTGSALPKPGSGFEKINSDSKVPTIGQAVILLGYGCLLEDGVDRSFGALYQGAAAVEFTSAVDNLYTVTKGGSAVCFGDSGGGAYTTEGSNPNIRRLIAVNSKGDISEYSWLSSTATDLFLEWAMEWAGSKGVHICGIHEAAAACRQ